MNFLLRKWDFYLWKDSALEKNVFCKIIRIKDYIHLVSVYKLFINLSVCKSGKEPCHSWFSFLYLFKDILFLHRRSYFILYHNLWPFISFSTNPHSKFSMHFCLYVPTFAFEGIMFCCDWTLEGVEDAFHLVLKVKGWG